MEKWESMINFAIELVKHANKHNSNDIYDQRIAIVSLDHAAELLMKAYLWKEEYVIHEIDKNKFKKGLKQGTRIDDIVDKNRTIGFNQALEIISEKTNFNSVYKKLVKRFHKIRNEIQHRSTELGLDKGEAIKYFYPAIEVLYEKMFPDSSKTFPKSEFH